MVDASLVAVTSVMINIERKLHWVAKIKEAKVVKQLSNFERIEYNQTKAPWPIANRDFVFHAKLTPSPDLKTVLVTIQSTEDDAEPVRDGVVRGTLNSSRFFLESINDQQTRVTVEIHADPKGSIPKWVVNLFQKGWPLDTINGIRKEVVSPEFAIHPKAKEALSPAKLTELP